MQKSQLNFFCRFDIIRNSLPKIFVGNEWLLVIDSYWFCFGSVLCHTNILLHNTQKTSMVRNYYCLGWMVFLICRRSSNSSGYCFRKIVFLLRNTPQSFFPQCDNCSEPLFRVDTFVLETLWRVIYWGMFFLTW